MAKSSYTLTGDPTQTVSSLMASPQEGSSDLSTLSTENYPNGGNTPNQNNQHVFLNQPLSWWLEQLNSGSVRYTPISSLVNWSYVNASGSAFYIDRSVSDAIIPNKVENTESDPQARTSTIMFEPKYGLGRRDTYTH